MADDILKNLHDIHLPAPIGWWPPAPGWIVIGIVVGVGLVVGGYWFYQRHVQQKAKCQALRLLASYKEEYQRDGNGLLVSARISQLLRRVALAYFPREEAAGLVGEAWAKFLKKTSKNTDLEVLQYGLLELPYQHNSEKKLDLNPLFQNAEKWIKQRGKPCSN